jgi:hypothetical protein
LHRLDDTTLDIDLNTTDAAGDWLVTMTHAPSVPAAVRMTDPRAAPEQPLAAWEEDLNDMCQASPVRSATALGDHSSTRKALVEVERQFVPVSLDAAAGAGPPLRAGAGAAAGVGVGSAGDPCCDERWGHTAGGSALERERRAHRAAEARAAAAGEEGVVVTVRNSWADGLEGLWESARSLAASASSVLLGTDAEVMLASPMAGAQRVEWSESVRGRADVDGSARASRSLAGSLRPGQRPAAAETSVVTAEEEAEAEEVVEELVEEEYEDDFEEYESDFDEDPPPLRRQVLPTTPQPNPNCAALRADTNKEVRDLLSHMELCMDGGGPLSGSGECFGAERLEDVPASARLRKWTQTKHECIRGLGMRDFEDVYHFLKCACRPLLLLLPPYPGGASLTIRRPILPLRRNARTELKDVLDEDEIIRNLSEMMGGSKARLNHCFKVDMLVYEELLTAEAATATAH